ncbi:MAG: PilW family protein [Clostridium sp.]
MKKKKGFTLVELLAVAGISTILGALILSLVLSLSNYYGRLQKETIFHDNARLAFASMENDLRAAKNINTYDGVEATVATIDGVDYNFSTASKVYMTFTKTTSSGKKAYAYVVQNKTLFRTENSGTNLIETNSGYGDIDDISVIQNIKPGITPSDPPLPEELDKGYKVELKFKDSRNNTESYETVITPRN